MTTQAREDLTKICQIISKTLDIEKIYLFGSYARGDATSSSDIDLRVDKGRLKGFFALGALYSDIKDRLDKPLDLLTTGSLDQSFLSQIAKEEILLYDESKS